MAMTDRLVAVRMAVRLRPLPALVFMAVVLVVDVRGVMLEGMVDVLDLDGIVRGPEGQRRDSARRPRPPP